MKTRSQVLKEMKDYFEEMLKTCKEMLDLTNTEIAKDIIYTRKNEKHKKS